MTINPTDREIYEALNVVHEDDMDLNIHVTVQETEQDPNMGNDNTYQGYLGDGEYAD